MPRIVAFENVWGDAVSRLAETVPAARVADSDPSSVADPKAVEAIFVRNKTQVDAALMDSFPNLKVVARAGVGLDNIDIPEADRRGIVVVSPKGANAVSVAEHALGLVLAVARRIVALDKSVRTGGWDREPGFELAGGTWGVLGAGATGLACARLAQSLGMTVLAYDPYCTDEALERLGVEPATLDAIARRSTVVTAHMPETAETKGMIDAEFLGKMAPTAVFVNVGRGGVVDEDALADALERDLIAGAALDVRVSEPPAPGRLEQLPNVVLTPHVAGITIQSQRRIMEALADDVERVLSGQGAHNAVGASTRPGLQGART